MIDENIYYPV